MILAHKIALDPNETQRIYFAKAAGTERFAWNWALAEWQQQYKAGERPSETALRRQLNAIKREQFPWMLEVTKVAPRQAIKNLGAAFQRFFAHEAKYPRFKKMRYSRQLPGRQWRADCRVQRQAHPYSGHRLGQDARAVAVCSKASIRHGVAGG